MTIVDREIDLLDGTMYQNGAWETYAWLRANAPVYWDATNELWGISRYDDITQIERATDVFISSDQEKGGYRPNLPADSSIIGLDDPLHTERRKLVNRGFTPRAVKSWEEEVAGAVSGLLDAAREGDQVEVVSQLAAPLPAQMIGALLGYPSEMWPKLKEWSERTIVSGGGPRYLSNDTMVAFGEFGAACAELFAEKQRCPANDIMTTWTTARVDGTALELGSVISDCLLLLDGGAETTRTVIGRTILELAARPDQFALLRHGADLAVATEEFIRWVTPILNMCRVATRDYEIGGRTIRQGQQVVLMYPSANRDKQHFDDPDRFDVTRQPNHHLSFGLGTHFCLGAPLARLEIRLFFEAFVKQVRSIRVVPGSVDYLANAFVAGLTAATVELDWDETGVS
jgi:cholest-4-en-3-one 26-monooxygenase